MSDIRVERSIVDVESDQRRVEQSRVEQSRVEKSMRGGEQGRSRVEVEVEVDVDVYVEQGRVEHGVEPGRIAQHIKMAAQTRVEQSRVEQSYKQSTRQEVEGRCVCICMRYAGRGRESEVDSREQRQMQRLSIVRQGRVEQEQSTSRVESIIRVGVAQSRVE